jgi:multidrug efflux pump subunit AcrB
VTGRYRRLLSGAVRRPGLVLGGSFAALALVPLLVRGLGNEFLPSVDDGNVGLSMVLAPGTSPQRTNETALRLEAAVREMPYVRHIFATAGGSFFGSGTAERPGRGNLDVQLAPATERPDMPAVRWVALMQRKLDSLAIPGARINVRPPRIRGLRTNLTGADVAVNVQGEDLSVLTQVGGEVMRRLQGIPGLEGIQPSAEEASPQLAIRIDRERAADLGLSVAAVGQTVRTALDGSIPTRFTDGANEYDLRVRLPRENFRSAEDVGAVALFAGADRPIYLRDVADVRLGLGPTSILRTNQNRQLRITADVNDDLTTVGTVTREVRARLADLTLPDGYALIYGGEEEAIRENQRNLLIVTVLAVFLVFVVMAVQYESATNPLVILVSIPFALVGVALALRVSGTPLSAPVLLGVILLAGIVVNNAILLVEYVELARERGLPPVQAVVEAGAVRLRPILMTTTTTVLGMSPLALGLGEGSEMMQPLAISVIGGLLVSTLLTLVVVPCSYLVIKGAAARLRAWVLGVPAQEEAPAAAD